MGKDYRLHDQHCLPPIPIRSTGYSGGSADPNYLGFMSNSSRREFSPANTNQNVNELPANGSLPGIAVGSLPQSRTSQVNGPYGWFYCLPRHRQAMTSPPNAVSKELPSSPLGYGEANGYGGEATLNAITQESAQKRFLGFDQSEGGTNLFFGSGVADHFENPSCGGQNHILSSGLDTKEPMSNKELTHQAAPVIISGLEEENDDRSEMHEDTEELNALLYSDDEDEYDEDEISTGHSPCDMNGEKQEKQEGEEEVASSACPIKRKRQLDDTESSCGEGGDNEGEMGLLLPENKRQRREKIRETINILQSIIPGGKGKDAILVLDEAIEYLRKLKTKSLK